MNEMYNNVKVITLAEAADLAHTDTQSNYVDREGYAGLMIIVAIGALTGVDTSNYVTPILQEAADTPASAGSYSTVSAAQVLGAFSAVTTTALDSCVQAVEYKGTDRYVNVKLDYTGTGISAGIVGVYAILYNPRKASIASVTPTTGAVS